MKGLGMDGVVVREERYDDDIRMTRSVVEYLK
jgi:hypothetical protein